MLKALLAVVGTLLRLDGFAESVLQPMIATMQALQTSLVSNLKKAIGAVAPSMLSSSPKRPRLESGASIPGTSTSMLQLQRAAGL